MTATLMIQGTTSDAGKSTLVAALCRWLARQGVRVAPFKPQNMALNSAVTVDGGEIGRAQAVQARACFLEPHTDFNPVLLKPNSDVGAQVIIHGRPVATMDACDYHAYKRVAMDAVLASYARLVGQFDAIVVEGAGSPAEINLRDRDIANMGFAEAVDCPVVLVADIDRGGVFAHLVGTLALLSASERARVVGFVINKFRGDLSLLQSGLDWLERETGKPVLGVLPYLHGLHVEAEDALPREHVSSFVLPERGKAGMGIDPMNTPTPTLPLAGGGSDVASPLRVVVPALPRISNHTDFDALRMQPGVDFRFVGPDENIPPADLIVLPGSKSVRADLAWLRAQGWERAIQRHLRYGGKLVGICGGLQMLGREIADPHGIEGAPGTSRGLGLLDYGTVIEREKQLRNVRGTLVLERARVHGYEIHAGVTAGAALIDCAAELDDGRRDGALSKDNQILATYLHGLFDDAEARGALLRWAGMTDVAPADHRARGEAALDRLADAVEASLDTRRLGEWLCAAAPEA